MDSDIPESLQSFQAMLKLPDYPKERNASELPPPESFQRRLLMFLSLPAVAACGGILGVHGFRFAMCWVIAGPGSFIGDVIRDALHIPLIAGILAAIAGAPVGVLTWFLVPSRTPIPVAIILLITMAAGAIPVVFFLTLLVLFN